MDKFHPSLMSFVLATLTTFVLCLTVSATQIDIVGPSGSGAFGQQVSHLPNGNIVVTDPVFDSGSITDVGAVYLYNGATGTLISTMTGSTSGDQVGQLGITILSNGNYVVYSSLWDNGAVANAGAATWCSGTTGCPATVMATNSLVGLIANDFDSGSVTALANGNYVIRLPNWDKGSTLSDINVGAATFGSGTSGVAGIVSSTNSLIGSSQSDQIGVNGVFALANGNYIVVSSLFDNGAISGAGAVTVGNGTTGIFGVVTLSNSLVGSKLNDQVGSSGITLLSNSNFVVKSPFWDNGATIDVGAATFATGTGIIGVVALTNSLVGSTASDQVSNGGITALTNGNYVVTSNVWDNGAVSNAGAVTFGNGITGVAGAVSVSNSLVGTTTGDQIGLAVTAPTNGVTALSNGNYVVRSPSWDNGAAVNAGAVTFGNGTTGSVGAVTPANSLVGSTASDGVGSGGVTILTNGNYVVRSEFWRNGAITNAGAVTFGDGTVGSSGVVSLSNSLVGSAASDQVGSGGVIPLNNGNYVVRSLLWDNAGISNVGAATFGNGTMGVNGPVSSSNSLIGSIAGDQVGSGGITALTNGNYVVNSPGWDLDAFTASVGASTFCNGMSGTFGPVTATGSLIGPFPGDNVGNGGAVALANGNYVVLSPAWDNSLGTNELGAATFANGATGITGIVSSSNSLVGNIAGDRLGVGNAGNRMLQNGNFVLASGSWDNAGIINGGAVTYMTSTTNGVVIPANSILGTTQSSGVSHNYFFDSVNSQLVVGRPVDNIVTLFRPNSTAADVSISGRVMTGEGRGVRGAAVTITNSDGGSRSVITGAYGNFRFENVAAGETYVISVRSRRFSFSPRVVQVTDNITGLDFMAEGSGQRNPFFGVEGRYRDTGSSTGKIKEANRILAPGELDLTFNGTGFVRTMLGDSDQQTNATAIQPDGKILAAGIGWNGADFDIAVVRYNADGSLDTTFDMDGKVLTPVGPGNDAAYAIAIQPGDGKIVVAGLSNPVATKSNFVVVRYNPDGSRDPTFDSDGVLTTQIGTANDIAYSVIIQSDGKIVAAGLSRNGSLSNFAVARYNPNGSIDTTFDSDGIVTTSTSTSNNFAISALIQPDGKIVLAGNSFTANYDFALVRYNIDGSPDTSFDSDGKVTTPVGAGNDFAYSVALQPDGMIVAAGSSSNGSNDDFAVVRYNANGSPDAAFDTDGKVTTAIGSGGDLAYSVAIQPDGKIVAAGLSFNTNNDFAVVRYNPNGGLDSGFDTDGKVTTPIGTAFEYANSVKVQADGKIIAAGLTNNGINNDIALVRYNTDGSLDNAFDSDGKLVTREVGSNANLVAIATQSDGKIVAVGTGYNGAYNFSAARYKTDGTLDTSFGINGTTTTQFSPTLDSGAESVAIQSDGKIVVAGGFNGNFALVRYRTDGSLDPLFDGDGMVTTSNGYAYSVTIQSDGKIVVAGNSNNGSNNDFAVVRYNPDGSLDASFGSSGRVTTAIGASHDFARSVKLQSDGKIVVAGYSNNGSNNDFAIVRYDPNGILDPAFDTDGKVTTAIGTASDYAYAVAIQPDGKIVAAGSAASSADQSFAIVRYNSDGGLDNTFGLNGKTTTQIGPENDYIRSIAIQPDGKIVAAGTTFVSTTTAVYDFAMARYDANGTLDTSSFGTSGIVKTSLGKGDVSGSMLIQSSGKIVFGGRVDGQFAVLRYLSDIAPALMSVSGRVAIPNTRGVTNAAVRLTDANGVVRTVITGRNGRFTFQNIEAGRTYDISVNSRRFTFSPQTVEVFDNIANLDFVAGT